MTHPCLVIPTQPPVVEEYTIRMELMVLGSGFFLMERRLAGTVSMVVDFTGSETFRLSDSIVKVVYRLHWDPTAVEYLTVVER